MLLVIKSLHIIAIISWFTGLVYLGRVLVYHRDSQLKAKSKDCLAVLSLMEIRAWRIICNPALVVSVATGFYLAITLGVHKQLWFQAKFFLVLLMICYHMYLGVLAKQIKALDDSPSDNSLGVVFLKVINEVVTVLMIAIVFLVETRSIQTTLIASVTIFLLIGILMMGLKRFKKAK